MSLLLLAATSANAQMFPPLPPPFPQLTLIEEPVVHSPWDGQNIWVGPAFPPTAVTFGFTHSSHPWSLPYEADSFVLCAWTDLATDCDLAIEGMPATGEFALFSPAATLNPTPGPLSGPTSVVWDYDWSFVVPSGWRREHVTYQIGACVGSPPMFDVGDWADGSCAFSDPRTVTFSGY